ncbi:MAG TPA: transglutaminaseTgpA domain-containing protein [Polyangiaceae bacterium]
MSKRLLVALPLLCATLLLAAAGAPFFWPLGLSLVAAASVVVPWRGTATTFGALLWMIAGATGPILWVRNTATEPRLGLSAALLLLCIAAVRLFFDRPLFGRNFDRALVVFACVAEGTGAHSSVYPYGAVALVASLLVELGGGFAALRSWARTPRSATSVVLLSTLLATLVALSLPALDRATNRRFESLFAGRMTRMRFTPHVRLDESGFIRTSEDIVLRLHGAETDYLRGAVFDSFDGVYWSTSTRPATTTIGATVAGARTEVEATQATQWLFAPAGARIVSDTPWEADTFGVLHPAERGVTQWTFAPTTDSIDPPAPADLTVPPHLAPKLRELALAWTAGAADDHARAVALVQHLRGDFTYTLDRPPPPHGRSVLLDFLLVHREGHCELFASAFVVLARVLGIPARLVAGYRVVEHNGFGGYAVVRAKHAHAWAEAYVPLADGSARSAFEVFDATPAVEPAMLETRTRTVAAFFDYLWTSIGTLYAAAVASPERSLPALGGVVLFAFVVRALRNRRRRGAAVDDDTDAPPAAFRQFESRLASEGFVRDRAETLESLAERLEEAGRAPLSRALRRYVKARYGAGDASERDLARALEIAGE